MKQADMVALVTERRDLVAEPPAGDGLPWIEDELRVEPSDLRCEGWVPDYARFRFRERYRELTA